MFRKDTVMAISITLKDADKNGTGIDFNAYLKSFDKDGKSQ